MLKEGDAAPDVTLQTPEGGALRLSELKGRTLVLYFYPKDDTTGCTQGRVRDGGGDDPRRLEGQPSQAWQVHREI
jgi:hypothetical protein